MTTRFSVNPSETLPSFDIREQLAHREIFKDLLDRSKHGEILEFPKIVETYPHLREYRSYVLDLVYEDYCQRSAAGEICRTQEYVGTFPEYDTQIHELLEVHRFFHASGHVPDWLTEQSIWPLPGEDFLGYEICSELGRGAIGRVYLAREQNLGNRFVALKVSPSGHDEAQLLAKLNHPNVVPIYSVSEDIDSNLTAVCMPYKGRTTLADLLHVAQDAAPFEKSRRFWQELLKRSADLDNHRNDVPAEVLKKPFIETTLDLIIQMVKALVYVHEHNILHRDLKPSNILITPERVAMILDFNLSTDLTGVENRIGGTLPYMSPEQVEQVLITPRPQNSLDERTDLYSIGVICYELLTGRLPFPAKSAGVVTKAEAIEYVRKIQAGAEPIQRYVPDLDDRTAKLVHRCLEFDWSKRPDSACSLLAELEKCRGLKAQARRSVLRHPRRVAIGLAICCLMLIFTGFFFLTRPPLFQRQLELGKQQLKAGYNIQAKDSLLEAYASVERNPEVLKWLGRAQLLCGEENSAKKSWGDSIKLNPDPKLASYVGYLESKAGNYENALKFFELAKPQLTTSSALCNNLAHTYRLLGKPTHALAFDYFDKALELDDKHDLLQALIGRAYLALMTDVNAGISIRSGALSDIDLAIKLSDPSPELLVLGAVCHLAVHNDQAHYEAAKKYALRALNGGMSYEDLAKHQLSATLLADPDIVNNRSNPNPVERIPQESNWIDPSEGLFELP